MIDVVCTGRDTHDRQWLAEVDESEPMRPRREGRQSRRLSAEEQRQMDSATARPGYDPTRAQAFRFRCGKVYEVDGRSLTCPLDMQLGPDVWQKLMDGVIAGGMTTVDLSRLPF